MKAEKQDSRPMQGICAGMAGLECANGLSPELLYALMYGLPGGAIGVSRDQAPEVSDSTRCWMAPPRPDFRKGQTWVLSDSCGAPHKKAEIVMTLKSTGNHRLEMGVHITTKLSKLKRKK